MTRVPLNQAQEKLLTLGVRVTDLARLVGVSKMSASRWLRAEKTPDDEHAAAIESALGVPRGDWRLASEAMRALQAKAAAESKLRTRPSNGAA